MSRVQLLLTPLLISHRDADVVKAHVQMNVASWQQRDRNDPAESPPYTYG